ncbi:hypothetical protein [Tunturiibacter lichenicola]|uniref:hypothetical protein n=1 Tax=Tunturiibacter lichenicola TaxID=2051959 RepID=UPI003D9B55DB
MRLVEVRAAQKVPAGPAHQLAPAVLQPRRAGGTEAGVMVSRNGRDRARGHFLLNGNLSGAENRHQPMLSQTGFFSSSFGASGASKEIPLTE